MREIIFRGKSKNDGEWICGGAVHQTDFYGDKVDRWFIIDGTETFDNKIGKPIRVIPETIGQYTGLTDKNGAKIFEGDIVKYYGICKPIIGVVKICEEDFSGLYGVCEAFTDGSGTSLLKAKIDCQVVGNIYDTPELLKQGNDDCIYADFNKKAEV